MKKSEIKKYVEDYHKENGGFKGYLTGFPIEVVVKMCENQVEQGNEKSIPIFEKGEYADIYGGGFTWKNSNDDSLFWTKVITFKNFDLFFKRYPKEFTPKRGDKVLVRDDEAEEWKERIFLTEIEGECSPFFIVAKEHEDRFERGDCTFLAVNYKQMRPLKYLTIDDIGFDSSCLPKWANKFIVADRYGTWYSYSKKPELKSIWLCQSGAYLSVIPKEYAPKNYNGDWKYSLFEVK